MVFTSPTWVSSIAGKTHDSISIPQFMLEEKYGRHPLGQSQNPFTCGISGTTYTAKEMADRVEYLAKGLAKELEWYPNEGTEWDKVAGIFSFNTVDYMTVVYAIHRLSGIVTPANEMCSSSQLENQMRFSGAKVLFTCAPLLVKAFRVAKSVGIPNDRIFILEMPDRFCGDQKIPFINISGLIRQGTRLPPLDPLNWKQGQGALQTAYLCYTSGATGHPNGVMISHSNVISNVIQITNFENACCDYNPQKGTSISLGLLSFSNIYGLVVVANSTTWRGDGLIILPKFEIESLLSSIQRFRADSLYLLPPMLMHLKRNPRECDRYDLTSVKTIFTGAASFDAESAKEIQRKYPSWVIRPSYGLTESSAVVSHMPRNDIFIGSSGCLVPGVAVKLISENGEEITGYDQPGELIVQSPSVMQGYLKNDLANKETFIPDISGGGKWIRTGDMAMIRKSDAGNEHIFIIDHIKDLIQVKDKQVAPTELEAHLLSHPFVIDCAVISVPDEIFGRVPKAFIVKAPSLIQAPSYDLMIKGELCRYVEEHKAKYMWLEGGVEFVDFIPKSQDGKILRRLLKNRETTSGAKL